MDGGARFPDRNRQQPAPASRPFSCLQSPTMQKVRP